jgi:hypothetical protein
MEIRYEIFDLNGVRYHKEYINVVKGTNTTLVIRPDSDLTNGILVNIFTLPDGSTKVIQTLKQ